MPSRFLNNININDEYSFPSADGSADQIITTDGAGQLSFVDQGTIAAESAEVVEVPVKNVHTATILKGTPVYIFGSIGSSGRLEVKPADAGVAQSMPALGLLKQDLAVNAEGFCVISGKLRNLITSPIDGVTTNDGDVVYVKAGGGLTTTKPTGSANLIQNMGKVGVSSTSSNGTFVVSSILRSNDVPNLTTGKIWVGSAANTIESATVHLDEANGRMGIGIDSPSTVLHVGNPSTSASSTEELRIQSATSGGFGGNAALNLVTGEYGNSGVYFGDNSTYTSQPAHVQWVDVSNILEYNSNGTHVFKYSGSEIFRTNGTLIGMGVTSTPVAKLDIDYSGVALNVRSSQSVGIKVRGGGNLQDIAQFASVGGTVVAALDNAGQLGVGTNDPQAELHVQSVANGTPTIRLNHNSTYPAWMIEATQNNSASPPRGQLRWDANPGATGMQLVYWNSYTENALKLDGQNFKVINNGSERMRIDSTGDVGIGTTGPGAKLDVKSSSSNSIPFQVTNSSDTDAIFSVLEDGGGDGRARIFNAAGTLNVNLDSSGNSYFNGGNVGIGTTSPAYPLAVTGDIKATAALRAGTNLIVGGYTDIHGEINHRSNIRVLNKTASNWLTWAVRDTTGTEAVIDLQNIGSILAAGNVGIGTTSPSQKLHVYNGTAYVTPISYAANQSAYALKVGAYNNTSFDMGLQLKSTSGGSPYMSFETSNTDDVLTMWGGSVGVGALPSPSYKLDVDGQIRGEQYLRLKDTGGTNQFSIRAESTYGTLDNGSKTFNYIASNHLFLVGTSEKMRINSSGGVGIGTTNPSEKLEVNGVVKAVDGYKGYVSHFHSGGFDHFPRINDGANPFWIPSNYIVDASADQYYNIWVPLYAGRIRKIIMKNVTGTPTASVCTFYKRINGTTSGTTYAGTVTGGGAAGMKVTFDFGTTNFTFNAEDEVQLGFVTGVATQPSMRGVSYQIWYEYNIT